MWKRRMSARSVQNDLHVEGCILFSKCFDVSWKGGSYIYIYIR